MSTIKQGQYNMKKWKKKLYKEQKTNSRNEIIGIEIKILLGGLNNKVDIVEERISTLKNL